MAIAPMSADQSAAAWAGEAAGAAEAYVQSQADAAAAQRDYEEKLQAQLAALAALAASQNDGLDAPPPPNPIGSSPVGSSSGVGSSGGSSPVTSSTGGGGSAQLVPDGNGNFTILTPVDNIVVPQQAPQPWDYHLPIGNAGSGTSSVQTPSNTPPPPDPPAPTSGPNHVNEPDQPEKPKEAPKIVSGFGKEIDALLNLSPTMRRQVEQLLNAKWQILEAPPGKTSVCDPNDQIIYISREQAKGDLLKLASLFAHEIGHAASGFKGYIPPDGLSKNEYLWANVQKDLGHEGGAAFESLRYREEIRNNGGPDIGIAAVQDDKYEIVYDAYKNGGISEEEAKTIMGGIFASERRSTDGQTYREGLFDYYENRWREETGSD